MVSKKRMALLRADKLLSGLLNDEEKDELKNLRLSLKNKKVKKSCEKYVETFENPSSLNMFSYMDGLVDPSTGVIRDLRIDDRDLPKAKNYYDFCINIVKGDINPPWARQFIPAVITLGEVCPKCCNPLWLNPLNVKKDFPVADIIHPKRLTLLEDGVCPSCGLTKQKILNDNLANWYTQFVYVWGQRSGKSSTAALMCAYLTHLYMKFPMLSSLTKAMQKSTQLTGIFCSLTYEKAVDVLWTPYKNNIDNISWFRQYFDLLDSYKDKYGTELYVNGKTSLQIMHKNLYMFPTGPTASKLRGNTSIFCVLDELGMFPLPDPTKPKDDNDVNRRADSDEAYKSLNNSLLTVNNTRRDLIKNGYNSVPPSFMGSVSSPIDKKDKVMRLLNQSYKSNTIYGSQLATWEINPFIDRNSPDIVDAFEQDADKAMRDFGAKPSSSHNTFFSRNVVPNAFCGSPNTFKFQYKTEGSDIWIQVNQVSKIRYPSVMSLDAGYSNNSFAISVSYYDFDDKKIKVACALECIPDKNTKVNFTKLYKDCLLPIAKGLNCVFVLADQWNSIDLLQRLKQDLGKKDNKSVITPIKYSLKREDFDSVNAMLRNGNIIFPAIPKRDIDNIVKHGVADYKQELYNKPIHHLLLQLLTVVDTGPGRCPDKAPGYTDDILRAVVLSAVKIMNPKVMAKLEKARTWIESSIVMPEPIVIGRSSGFYI